MIDIHSHILYGCDDGAKNIEESLKLLKLEKQQGVDTVYLTPHFDSNKVNLTEFLKVVKENYNNLYYNIQSPEYPKIKLGFEVRYFNGIKDCDSLELLSLSDTKFILIELNYEPITNKIIEELTELSWYSNYTPIMAHIERYHKLPGYKNLLKEINNSKIYCQVTANSFLRKNVFNKEAFKLLKHGYVNFIASDAHSVLERPPYIVNALNEIQKKYDKYTVNRILDFEKHLFI